MALIILRKDYRTYTLLSVDLDISFIEKSASSCSSKCRPEKIECKKVPLKSAGEPEPSNVAVKVAELANLNGDARSS
jgi:hypothetical protein